MALTVVLPDWVSIMVSVLTVTVLHLVHLMLRLPPLSGIRVLDFGIGGVGVETSRLLAEYGADVIKVETRTYLILFVS